MQKLISGKWTHSHHFWDYINAVQENCFNLKQLSDHLIFHNWTCDFIDFTDTLLTANTQRPHTQGGQSVPDCQYEVTIYFIFAVLASPSASFRQFLLPEIRRSGFHIFRVGKRLNRHIWFARKTFIWGKSFCMQNNL